MNRRAFLTSSTAFMATPALPLPSWQPPARRPVMRPLPEEWEWDLSRHNDPNEMFRMRAANRALSRHRKQEPQNED